MLPLNHVSQGKYKVLNIDTPLIHTLSKAPRSDVQSSRLQTSAVDAAAESHGRRSTQLPEVHNSNSKPDPLMSRLYLRPRDVKDKPRSQMLMNQFPSPSENSSTIAHHSNVLRSTSHDETMKPVKPPNYSAVHLHQRALVARCSPEPDRKSGDEVYSRAELHSPTFPQVLEL